MVINEIYENQHLLSL